MYPVFLHLKQIPCLVVGAGVVAQRRIFSLLEQEADVTVLAPEPIPLPLQRNHCDTYRLSMRPVS